MAVPATSLASSATAQSVTNAQWYSTIVFENTSTVTQYVRVDGTTATVGGAGCEAVSAGAVGVFPNQQVLPNANGNGGNPLTFGWTDQNNNTLYTSGSPTFVSFIGASAGTGDVTVSLQ